MAERFGKRQLMNYDLIIKNGPVVSMNAGNEIFSDGLICVKDGIIKFAGARDDHAPDANAEITVDAKGGIIMPGLVNSHMHAPMSMFRGLADDLPLLVWLNQHIFPAEAKHVSPQLVMTGSMLSCAEMLLGGTTCFCDGYFYEGFVARAVEESGMRAVLGHGIIDYPAPGVPDPKDNVKTASGFAEEWMNRSGLITPSLFCHSPYTCSEKTIVDAKKAADELGLLLQIHAAETLAEYEQMTTGYGKSPIQFLDGLGVLDENTLIVHGIWVDEKDMETLAKRGSGVSVTTHSEMKLASGVAPIPDYLKAGVKVGLGTDGPASNNTIDMFSEMDLTAKIHKAVSGDPTELGAWTVLGLATKGSAQVMGLGQSIGSLETGKKADIMVLDSSSPRLAPLFHPESAIVYSAGYDDVSHVFVEGRQLVKNGELLHMDLKAVLEEARELAKEIGRGD